MKAMVLDRLAALADRPTPLTLREVATPEPGAGDVRVKVRACGVCHTELDEIEGRTPPPRLPVIPGHEVVGVVDRLGAGVTSPALGSRVGIGWIHHSDGSVAENLSPAFTATGRDADGGYAEYMVVPAAYAHPLPEVFSDVEAAPLLCAGAVGYRALKLSGLVDGAPLGLMGFGGSAHLVLQLARYLHPHSPVQVFARDAEVRDFARGLGAAWAGGVDARAPAPCAAIIDTTPAWHPIVAALANLRPGGRLVINAIRKEDRDRAALDALSYHDHLWLEREIKSVANVTGADIREFLALAAAIPIRPAVTTYPLAEANRALCELKDGRVQGAKVLVMHGDDDA
ncbi:MAG: alcohol dehydrogenase catalytic domain-containing protein [Gammaproteobacteria bacterium]|nr:alcohol dehydrogenase catalytic domain-containing protein [Gammaproteobacteria bacterium]